MNLKKLALKTIEKIESSEIQERCTNHNSTWEETKELFLKEAEKGDEIFWEALGNFEKVIVEENKKFQKI